MTDSEAHTSVERIDALLVFGQRTEKKNRKVRTKVLRAMISPTFVPSSKSRVNVMNFTCIKLDLKIT